MLIESDDRRTRGSTDCNEISLSPKLRFTRADFRLMHQPGWFSHSETTCCHLRSANIVTVLRFLMCSFQKGLPVSTEHGSITDCQGCSNLCLYNFESAVLTLVLHDIGCAVVVTKWTSFPLSVNTNQHVCLVLAWRISRDVKTLTGTSS